MLRPAYQIDRNVSIAKYQMSSWHLRGMVPFYAFLQHNPYIHLHDHPFNRASLSPHSLLRERLCNEGVQTFGAIARIGELCHMSWPPADFLQPNKVYQPWTQEWTLFWSSFSKCVPFHRWMPPWILCLPLSRYTLDSSSSQVRTTHLVNGGLDLEINDGSQSLSLSWDR